MAAHLRTSREPGAVTAVLGPTNTGKTHLALERMLGRASGVIGLPLRLLAREIYDKVVKAKGAPSAALVTGEEKIVPPTARYFVCTVEAMPRDMRPAFLAVDEIQLCADPERGHLFTERLLHARGTEETMFMGAATIAPLIRRLAPEAELMYRERFSQLSYAGPKKVTRLPRRSAIVAFSANDVYSIAELIRRQRGGAAVVMGALSPRTRNAQVELYQSGEVDYLIATDAIGMGLNMDVDHVAFAGLSKFDGRKRRRLFAHEVGQIAGRAGRFRTDGSFGETADCRPIDPEIIEAVEDHRFEPLTRLAWRNDQLDASNLQTLRESLGAPPPDRALERVRSPIDEAVLDLLARDGELRGRLEARGAVALLWDACRTPDFRKTTLEEHARLVKRIFVYRTQAEGFLPDSWLEGQLKKLSRTSGEVDALSQRLAHVRTWAYAAHRKDWVRDTEYWTARTREVEDLLSDALHERLIARFIDRRTSALMKGLREKIDLDAIVAGDGLVTVEGHAVGEIEGLRFSPATGGGPLAQRAVRNAALKAVRPEMNRRLGQLVRAEDDAFTLTDDAKIVWRDQPVARLAASSDPLAPGAELIGGELASDEARARAERRVEAFIARRAARDLAGLAQLRANANGTSTALTGLARGVAFRLAERFGAAARNSLADDLSALSVQERRQLRAAGVRIGEHAVFMPALIKPVAARLSTVLKAVHDGRGEPAFLPEPGRTSLPARPAIAPSDYAAAGYQRCGPLVVRLDMLERLADLIRDARAAPDPDAGPGKPSGPKGAKGAFALDPAMTSLLGCGFDDLRAVLKALGYKRVQRAKTDAGIDGERWIRSRRPAHRRPEAEPEKPREDTPFAKLAELKLPDAPPARTASGEHPKRRRPRRRKTAGGEAGKSGA
ncbi:MAG: helicase-related protein [Pseudomonadota bacterium]